MPPSLIKNNPYYTPQQQDKFSGYTQLAGAATSLLPAEQNPYSFDKFSSLKGAGQGAAAGAQLGGPAGAIAGAVVGGLTGGIGSAIKQAKNLDRINTNIQGVEYDEYGQPTYQSGDIGRGLNELNMVSSAYDNTKWGDFNRRKMRNVRNELQSNIQNAQNQFNQANIGYNQQLLARAQYEDQIKKNNIYNFPMQLI